MNLLLKIKPENYGNRFWKVGLENNNLLIRII